MKLATEKSTSRDGSLLVVSRDLQRCVAVPQIAANLQSVLDNWDETAAQLDEIYNALNAGHCENVREFARVDVAAPLPRAYQWIDGSAYVNHVELVRKARGAVMPAHFWTDPLMYQGGSDHMLGARDVIEVRDESYGIDFEAEVAVITSDVPMAVTPAVAQQLIRFVVLVNDVSLRNLIPAELDKGFGFFQSKPASSFSPVVVTPDELGDAWDGKKLHLPLVTHLNDELFGQPNAGVDMTFDFPTLISHAAKTRNLIAGSIVGSGTVSNSDRSSGSACIAEKRMLEILQHGSAQTSFMRFGDRVRIEMFSADQQSIFGAIDQVISPASSREIP